MTISEQKKVLRHTIRQLERELSPAYRTEANRRIAALTLSLRAYRNAGTVCCFVGTAREIDTRPILENALNAGKRLCVPRCDAPGEMTMREIAALDQLSPGTMGILEPSADAPVTAPENIDFAVLPCLSCDIRGNRLGYGGGYYDRFLRAYHGAAVLLCRERLLQPAIPMESHDIAVPCVLTERRLYTR